MMTLILTAWLTIGMCVEITVEPLKGCKGTLVKVEDKMVTIAEFTCPNQKLDSTGLVLIGPIEEVIECK